MEAHKQICSHSAACNTVLWQDSCRLREDEGVIKGFTDFTASSFYICLSCSSIKICKCITKIKYKPDCNLALSYSLMIPCCALGSETQHTFVVYLGNKVAASQHKDYTFYFMQKHRQSSGSSTTLYCSVTTGIEYPGTI